MRKVFLVILFSLTLFAETITIQPKRAERRRMSQNVPDIYYDLKGGVLYEDVFLYFSTDMKNYRKEKGQSGDIGTVEVDKNRHIR